MEQTARRQEQLPGAFNGAITNSQHGRVRWYLVHTPNGKERETCEKVRRIIPHELMQDAFVMQKEFWFKRDGAWSLQTKPMYKEYFFVATRDAAMLDKALAQLSFGCRIAGSRERAYAPMPPMRRTGTAACSTTMAWCATASRGLKTAFFTLSRARWWDKRPG